MGRIGVGKVDNGVIRVNQDVVIVNHHEPDKMKKVKGAIVTALGTALPSFLIILLIAMFFRHAQDNRVVEAMFRGIRPAVVALIAVPTFNMAKSARIGWSNCWIPIASAFAIWALGVSPIIIIILAALGGYLYGKIDTN